TVDAAAPLLAAAAKLGELVLDLLQLGLVVGAPLVHQLLVFIPRGLDFLLLLGREREVGGEVQLAEDGDGFLERVARAEGPAERAALLPTEPAAAVLAALAGAAAALSAGVLCK